MRASNILDGEGIELDGRLFAAAWLNVIRAAQLGDGLLERSVAIQVWDLEDTFRVVGGSSHAVVVCQTDTKMPSAKPATTVWVHDQEGRGTNHLKFLWHSAVKAEKADLDPPAVWVRCRPDDTASGQFDAPGMVGDLLRIETDVEMVDLPVLDGVHPGWKLFDGWKAPTSRTALPGFAANPRLLALMDGLRLGTDVVHWDLFGASKPIQAESAAELTTRALIMPMKVAG